MEQAIDVCGKFQSLPGSGYNWKEDKRTYGMDLMDQVSLLQFISSLMAHEK